MAHLRQQIRERIVSDLASAVTLVSGRVYDTRLYPFRETDLPAINVTAMMAETPIMTMGGYARRRLMETISISVDCHVSVTDTFDDDLDAICVQVEEALAADFDLGGLAKQTLLDSTAVEIDSESERPVGVAKLTYSVNLHPLMSNVDASWILANGVWEDPGIWYDTSLWKDSA